MGFKKPRYCIGCIKDCNGFTQYKHNRCPLGIIQEAKTKGVPITDITHPAICEPVPMLLSK